MFKLILKLLKLNNPKANHSQQRVQVMQLSHGLGFINNLIVFVVKLSIGLSINSIAIISDAVNNLSDLLSTSIALISTYLAHKPADDMHPEGHGRFEYIGSLVLSFVVFAIGFELLMQSIARYTSSETPVLSLASVFFMVMTMGIKMWMYVYNRYVSQTYHSEMNQALAVDSLTDVLTSALILLSLAVNTLTRVPIDALAGSLIAIMIMYTAFNITRKMVSRLLGTIPDVQILRKIEDILMSDDQVQQIHELKIHDYGPNNMMGSVHVEVYDTLDLVAAHAIIDALEQDIFHQTNIVMTVHLDPIPRQDNIKE